MAYANTETGSTIMALHPFKMLKPTDAKTKDSLVLEKPSGTSGTGFHYRPAVLPVTQPTVLIG